VLKKLRRLNRWDHATAVRVMTLWFCAGDRRAGLLARGIARFAVLYAYSPIDLIPDFIPFIGHLDDLLIIPLVTRLLQRWVPAPVWQDAPQRAHDWVAQRGATAKPRGVRIALCLRAGCHRPGRCRAVRPVGALPGARAAQGVTMAQVKSRTCVRDVFRRAT